MSLLRPSIAGRLLRNGAPAARKAFPGAVRFQTSEASSVPATQSPATTKVEDTKDTQVRHNQPDYAAEVDQAAS